MNKLIKILVTLCLFVGLNQPLYADSWRLDKDENGIKIYTRAVQGSAIREIKGELVLDCSLDSIMAVFDDIPAFPRWNHQCTKAVPLKRVSATERYHYQNINMPFPVADRDLLIHSKISQKGEQVYVRLNAVADFCKSSSLDKCTAINQSKNIMVKRLNGLYQLTPTADGKTQVVWTQHTEPAGKIPNWLVNRLLIDVPFNTLSKLRKQVKLEKYQKAVLKRDDGGRILGF